MDKMSIQKKTTTKKDGTKTVRYYAYVYSPEMKKPIIGKLHKRRKDALRDEPILLQQLESGKLSNDDSMTFGECGELWLRTATNIYRASTFKTYSYYYARYIKDTFETSQIDHIPPLDVQTFVNTMSEEYSPETVNKCINILSNIFHFCINTLKVIKENDNPMTGIKRLNVPYTKKETWTNEQISAFLSSPIIKKNHYYPMFLMSLVMGMRPAEVCGLSESDLIQDNHSITINRTIDKDGNISTTKTQNSLRALFLPDTLYNITEQVLKRKLRLKSYHPDYQHDFLFTTIKGRPVNPNRYSMYFRKALKEYNASASVPLPVIPLYNCRHSFATNNYESGESDKVLSEIMGNTPKTFLSRYAHIRNRQTVKVMMNYEKALLPQR